MITHEMLVRDLVCHDVSVAECAKFDSCEECCDHRLSEYEDSIRKEAIRKFAEWFAKCSKVSEPVLEHTVNRWIEDYEQEQKNE